MAFYLFGLPIIENADEADRRRNDRTDRKEIEESSDVARWSVRSHEDALQTAYRNLDGSSPGEAIVGSVAGAAAQVGVAALGGGGGRSRGGGSAPDNTPLMLAGVGLLAVVLLMNKKAGK